MYEDHLIGIGVLVEIICHALLRSCKRYVEVVVDQYGFSAFQVIIFRLNVEPSGFWASAVCSAPLSARQRMAHLPA